MEKELVVAKVKNDGGGGRKWMWWWGFYYSVIVLGVDCGDRYTNLHIR